METIFIIIASACAILSIILVVIIYRNKPTYSIPNLAITIASMAIIVIVCLRIGIFFPAPSKPIPTNAVPKQYLTSPIDPLYFNAKKIDECYSQLEDELILVTRKIEQSSQNEVEANVGTKDISNLRGQMKTEGKTTEEYKANEKLSIRKFKELINYLHDKEDFLELIKIEKKSQEYQELTNSINNLENRLGIVLTNEQKRKAYDNAINIEITKNLKERFQPNKWIFIKGDFSSNIVGNEIIFCFNYFQDTPFANNIVIFETSIPKQKIDNGTCSLLLKYPSWHLGLFGKLIRHDLIDKKYRFLITPYVIFR